ncbi:hypothetical protein BWI97_20255 [Siphonobacter sp. BAB-5405]|uniref:MarR family winged helix-turn-helix transcriptional regulator n=1 Tax=Siphonobacter sp. BAB-5405 TaxID=1864825 RepID=UPI000C801893|nr:MarR family transcriptional regulator [Siphonobacter sp. BAB-5405]PMD92427.1 hypothetical protein BWI97_20255 [Siphonobacter sp. BAB-5405]
MNSDENLAHDLRKLVVSLYRQLQKQISNEEQLSVAAQNVLYQLTLQAELLPSELCTRLNISSQYISQVFHQLETLHYISRKPSPTDGRKTLVSLTETGRKKVLDSRRERETWLVNQMNERFSAADKEVVRKTIDVLATLMDTPPSYL